MLRKIIVRHKGSLAINVLGAIAAAVPHCAFAQVAISNGSAVLRGEWAVEEQVSERWLHERQQPRFTPRRESDEWVFVDSVRPAGAGQRIWLAIARNARPETAVIDVAPDGHVARLQFHRAAPPSRTAFLPSDSSFEDFLRRAPGGHVSLHETRAWDLVPGIPRAAPRIGLSWRDTIARVATDGAYRQALHGTRVSRIVGRRAVDGHELWVVRDSAVVRHDEEYPERERTLAGATVSRTVSGTIVGVHLWDPDLPIVRELDDTTILSGVAILRYPDRRSFRTPARFERTRHRALFDAAGYAARSAERSAEASRRMGGLVRVPEDSLDRRLAVGDTAFMYQHLANRAYGGHPFDTADVRAMLPFMRDPKLAWSFGLSRDILYENLAQALTMWPPVAASGTGDSACTPAACRLLAAQWPSAAEPRLRDVGLVARFVTDPRRWSDTVLARDGPAHPLLHGAARLARGVAATWDAASHAAIPAAGSDWRAWLQWMDGKDARWLAWLRQSSLPARAKADTLPQVRFEPSHATAIRFTEARTGRDIVAELQHGFDAASSDSARFVFGSMLQALGVLKLGEAEVADAFRSGDPMRITMARKGLLAGFARSAGAADSSLSIALLDRLLKAIVDSTPLWPYGVADLQANGSGPALPPRPRSVFFLDTLGMPPRIRAEWGSRITFLPKPAWIARDVRAPGVFYSIAPISTWGRFARVQMTISERFARKPDEAPRAYGAGMTYWLMNVDGQWVVVAAMGWVT
jgi:hypothetical protein